MSTARRVPGVVLALTGAAVGIEALTFNVGFMTDPVGPKALPLVVAATLILAGFHAAIRPPEAARWPDRAIGLQIGSAVGAFLAYAVALPLVGFFISTTLVVSALSHLYGASPAQHPGRGAPLWRPLAALRADPRPSASHW